MLGQMASQEHLVFLVKKIAKRSINNILLFYLKVAKVLKVNKVITVQPVDLVLWEKQLMLKRVTEVLMVSYKFFIFY